MADKVEAIIEECKKILLSHDGVSEEGFSNRLSLATEAALLKLVESLVVPLLVGFYSSYAYDKYKNLGGSNDEIRNDIELMKKQIEHIKPKAMVAPDTLRNDIAARLQQIGYSEHESVNLSVVIYEVVHRHLSS